MAVELATAYISLVPSAKGIGQNIAKEISAPAASAGKQAGAEMGKEMGKNAGKSFGVKDLVATIGGVAAVKGAFDFAGDAVAAASDVNESLSKTRTVFGENSIAIEMWAKNAAKNLGISRGEALDTAGTFGNMFTQLGIGTDQAAAFTQEMGGLASDLASFHNADVSDVIDSMTSAFRGEYDAVQRFVPTINAASVEQEALAETHKKTAKELTAGEKAIATQTLLMKGAGAATGDFARTSNGLANKQRIQAAQWQDLKVKIGSGLLPVITKLTGFFMTKVIPAMESIGAFVSHNKSLFVALGIGITAVLVPAFVAWAAAAAPAAAATLLAVAPAVALGAAVAAMAYLIIKNWDTIKSAISTAVNFVKGLVMGLIDVFKKIPGWIATALGKVADVITAPYRAAFNAIAKLWNNTVGKLHFKVPKWIPGIGGKGFDVPNIPTFHEGAFPVPGRPGQEILARVQAGETIIPAGMAAGGGLTMHNEIYGVDAETAVELLARKMSYRLRTVRS